MRAFLSALAFCAVLGFGPHPVHAETIGYGEAIRALTSACGADLERNCNGVKPGDGAIKACLLGNPANVSANCVATVEVAFSLLAQRAAAQEAVADVCKNDARRHCSDFRPGSARVLRCLIRPDIYRGVSKKCKAAITDAGWD